MTLIRWLILAAACAPLAAHADEGMWTFNNFPSAKVKATYGVEPTKAWLDHLRLSSVRIAGGCSASVVSADGLVMTNHHCARECIQSVSGLTKHDHSRDGFFAKTTKDEARCPGMELNQLTDIGDVTERVQAATQGKTAEQFADAQRAVIAGIEKACATSDEVRCEVVTLYSGGHYDLYKYRRLQDIRLVFAPEERIAFFGGDPDNFTFPRYDLDVSFVRVYGADGGPMRTPEHLAWSDGRIQAGDPTFVSGHPGGTSRHLTVAQLAAARDTELPQRMMRTAEFRGFLTQYQTRGAEERRQSNDMLFGFENWLKSTRGQQAALANAAFYAQLVQVDEDFRAKVMATPALAAAVGPAWDRIAEIVKKQQAYNTAYEALEGGPISELFAKARGLVRYAEESGKPNGERLKEFSDARLPQFRQRVLDNSPIYDEMEVQTLTWSLTKLREDLGPDHPVVRRVLGRKSPADVATAAVKGSRLKDVRTDKNGNPTGGLRKALFDGGKPAIDASTDPMIVLARAYDVDARVIRKQVETEVQGPLRQQQELLARARFAVYGDSLYPDATFTLRLSYGAVTGYEDNGKPVAPFTTIAGAFTRHTGAEPFELPPSWLRAKPKLNMDVPFNFVTSNDIIGGNSGSPVVNAQGEVVGLVFDGNLQSLGGDYGFDAASNRTVAVHSAALIEALDKVYGARRLVEEITAPAR